MKQRLLSVLAIAGMSITAMAQTWTEPVAPQTPAKALLELAAVPEADGNYFIMNVGEGQFLTGANVWATQISLSSDATPYMQVTLVAHESFENTFYMQRTNDAADKFYGDHGRDKGYNPPAGRNKIFRSGDDGYVDYNNNSGSSPLWMFNETGNGYYYIQSSIDDGVFPNAADEYAGSTGAGKYVSFTKTIEDENIEWAFIPVASVPEDFSAIAAAYATAVKVYEARIILYGLLNDAVTYNVDYSSASSVYNNADATLDEITAATEALKPVVAKAAVLASIASSSEENPLDITDYVLTNPSFNDGMTGWTITEGMGANLQVQGAKYENTDVDPVVTVQNFIEAWVNSANGVLKDGVICQTVSGLPEGRYRIEADVIAVWQGDALSEDPKGIYLFYNNGAFTLHSETLSTGNGVPEHFTFDFDYDGAETMTIGLMAENTNMNWMGMDNLKLSAIGEVQTPPAFFALQSSVLNSEELYSENEKAQSSLTEAFRTAYEEANVLANSNPEKDKANAYIQAYQKLDEAKSAYLASIKAYIEFNALIERFTTDMERYAEDENFAELIKSMKELQGTYEDQYSEGTASNEDIQKYIDNYGNILPEYVNKIFQEAAAKVAAGGTLENPIDITVLNPSLSFPTTKTLAKDLEDKYGWNFTATENFNENDGLKFEYQTAEAWSCLFDANTVIKNLPAGKYTVKVKGFYRPTTGEENLSNYEAAGSPELAWFYVNNGGSTAQKALINWDALLDYFPATTTTDESGAETEVENRPNNQKAAHELFAANDEASQLTEIEISTILRNGGDLTIGAKDLEGVATNCWIIWSDITLIYDGAIDASAITDELLAYIENAKQLQEEGDPTLFTDEAMNKLDTSIKAGEAAVEGDEAAQLAAIESLAEAIEYGNESQRIVEELINATEEYQAKLNEVADLGYTFEDEEYQEVVDDAFNRLEPGGELPDNETLQDLLDRIINGWYPYLFSMEGFDDASEENPVDMSVLITNANFDSNNKDGWTVVQEGNAGGDGNGCAEFWGATSFDIYQELPMLKDGYWRLSVDALYRYGGSASDVAARANGTITNPEYLYINNMKVNVISWSDVEKGAFLAVAEDGQEVVPPYELTNENNCVQLYSVTPAEGDAYQFWSVNTKQGFESVIALTDDNDKPLNRYHNKIVFEYTGGSVRLGLNKAEKPSSDNDWCPFDNFKLEYLGTEKPVNEEVADGISMASVAPTNTVTAIFSIDGRQQNQLRKGLNIVRTADGTVRKVLVK